MPPSWISASGTLYLGASGIASIGTVVVLRQGTTWDIYSSTTQGTFPGHALGVVMGPGNTIVPGNPVTVQTFGIIPPDYYLAGGGSPGTVVANGSGGISRGSVGQILGVVDSSGFLTLEAPMVASGGGLAGPVIGQIAGYALSQSPLAQGQFWSYDAPSATLVPTFVTSQLGVYGADLAGSKASTQYVQSISGNAGLGGPVTFASSLLTPATDLYSTLGTPATFRFSTVYTQAIIGGTHASAGAGNNSVFQAENANGSANAGGDAIIAPGISGSAARSGFTRFTQGGPMTTVGVIGNTPLAPYGALWLTSTAGMSTPTSVNYAIASDGTNLIINTIGSLGSVYFLNAGNVAGAISPVASNGSLFLFGPSGGGAGTSNYALKSDGTSLWHNTVSTNGTHYFLQAGVTFASVGTSAGQPSLWLGSSAPTATNETLFTDGSTFAQLNAPTTTGQVNLGGGGSAYITVNSGGLGGYHGNGSTPASATMSLQTALIPITTGTYTLTAAQAACPMLAFYGILTGNCTVVMPQARGVFWADTTSLTYATHQVTFAYSTTTKVYGTAASGVTMLAGNALDHLYGFPGQ